MRGIMFSSVIGAVCLIIALAVRKSVRTKVTKASEKEANENVIVETKKGEVIETA